MALARLRPNRLTKLLLRVCLITLPCFLWCYFLGIMSLSNNSETQQLKVEEDLNAYHSNTARRNLIIMSHGRSGSSLLGDIFNHHPSVFYMYEPLQTTRRVTGKSNEHNDYSALVQRFLTGIFRCKFDTPAILADIESYYRRSDHPRVSRAIASPPLCPYRMTDPRWDPQLCPPMTSESLGSACKDVYNLTVIKLLIDRIPKNSIDAVLTACYPLDVNCRVIFLVRDPRAVIGSSRSFGFFSEKGLPRNSLQGTRLYSYWQCKQTEDNLNFIKRLPTSLRKRIKLQRYEDLAVNPLKELTALFEFARLTVLESVSTWLNETTQQSRSDCDKMDGSQATCTKDNAQAAASRWRWKIHPHEIDIVEYYCGGVMRLLGYRPVNRSYDLLANVTIPLFYDDYEAKIWFLQ